MAERDWLGFERRDAPAARTRAAAARAPAVLRRARACDRRERGASLDPDTIPSPGSWGAALHAAGGAVARGGRAARRRDARRLLGPAPARPPRRAGGRDGLLPVQQRRRRPRSTRSTRTSSRACSCSTGTCTTATGRTTSSTRRARCCSPASTSRRSIRAPARSRDVGSAEGEGYSINLPVPPGSGEEEWLSLVEHVVLPAARAVRAGARARLGRLRRAPPRSAGELHARDLLVRASSRARCGAREDLDVPVGVVLEGGYDLEALVASVVATLEAFSSDDGEAPRSVEREAARGGGRRDGRPLLEALVSARPRAAGRGRPRLAPEAAASRGSRPAVGGPRSRLQHRDHRPRTDRRARAIELAAARAALHDARGDHLVERLQLVERLVRARGPRHRAARRLAPSPSSSSASRLRRSARRRRRISVRSCAVGLGARPGRAARGRRGPASPLPRDRPSVDRRSRRRLTKARHRSRVAVPAQPATISVADCGSSRVWRVGCPVTRSRYACSTRSAMRRLPKSAARARPSMRGSASARCGSSARDQRSRSYGAQSVPSTPASASGAMPTSVATTGTSQASASSDGQAEALALRGHEHGVGRVHVQRHALGWRVRVVEQVDAGPRTAPARARGRGASRAALGRRGRGGSGRPGRDPAAARASRRSSGRSRSRLMPHGSTATRRSLPARPRTVGLAAREARGHRGREVDQPRDDARDRRPSCAARRSSPWNVVTCRPLRTASEQAPVRP